MRYAGGNGLGPTPCCGSRLGTYRRCLVGDESVAINCARASRNSCTESESNRAATMSE